MIDKFTKGIITVSVILIAAVCICVVGCKLTMPYVIASNGQVLVVVDDKKAGKEVLKDVFVGYIPEDTEFKTMSLDRNIDLRQVTPLEYRDIDKVMTKDEAIAYLKEVNKTDDVFFNTTVTSEVVKEESFTPEIEYKKDDKKLAGTTKVQKEGSDGLQKVTYSITSINGEIKDKEVVNTEVIEAGEPAVIYKGVLGVPDGEDWRTYDGPPVFNGVDVSTTAQQYLGAPYKYGGYSFKTGIDCVQYVRAIYKMYGINLPNNHPGIRKTGKAVSYANAKPGDIICYKHHVALYIGNGKVAEASRKTGTRVRKVKSLKKVITIRHIGN